MTTATAPARPRRRSSSRPGVVARRTGYAIAVGINLAMLWATHVWPGWEALPFLTEDTTQVLGIVSAMFLVAAAANLVYLATDPPRLKALGDIVTTAIGLVALVRFWQVFPFDFGDASFDWALLARWVLGVGIVGSVIGMLVALVDLVRGADSRS